MVRYLHDMRTDITGFGLMEHGMEMASDSVSLAIHAGSFPVLESARPLAEEWVVYPKSGLFGFICPL